MFNDIWKIVSDHVKEPTFWKGIGVALLLAALAKIGQWLWNVVVQAWRSRQAFDIAGSWIGDCLLPSYQERQLEIWRYTRRGDDVKLRFFAYDPRDSKPRLWIGGGVYRGSKLSAYYYHLAQGTYESGVIALELKGLRLRGVYAQFDPKMKDEPLFVSQPDYTQQRIDLAFFPRMRMFFGFPPLPTYEEVKRFYDSAS